MADLNQVREGLREIDIAVHNLWALGKNMVVGWMADDAGLQVCFAPAYRVLSETTDNPHLLDGIRRMESRAFSPTCRLLQVRPLDPPLPLTIRPRPDPPHPPPTAPPLQPPSSTPT